VKFTLITLLVLGGYVCSPFLFVQHGVMCFGLTESGESKGCETYWTSKFDSLDRVCEIAYYPLINTIGFVLGVKLIYINHEQKKEMGLI